MQALVMSSVERAKLLKLLKFAQENPLSLEDVKATIRGERGPVGEDRRFTTELPVDIRVCYSQEMQPGGLCHHLSVSVAKRGVLPNPMVIQMIMSELGFLNPLEKCLNVWKEGDKAINVVDYVGRAA